MTIERYFQWMRVWKWFAATPQTSGLENLHDMLNVIWQDERENTTAYQLSEFGAAWALEEQQ
jgi:hypothetical protein